MRAISVYPSEGTTRAEAEAQCTATCAAEATGHSGTSPVTTLDRCSEGLFSAVEATPTPPASSAPADSGGSVTLFNPLGANVGVAEFISRGIRAVIGIIGAMALLMFIYGGVMWMTAGDSKRVESSKEILKNSTIGLLLIFFSYSIVSVIFSLLGTS